MRAHVTAVLSVALFAASIAMPSGEELRLGLCGALLLTLVVAFLRATGGAKTGFALVGLLALAWSLLVGQQYLEAQERKESSRLRQEAWERGEVLPAS